MTFKYRGILRQPRPYVEPLGSMADQATRDAWVQRYKAEAIKCWRALYEAHGVEWGNESELLWRMAAAHVPGFKTKGRSGPKSRWGLVECGDLRIAIDDYIADRKRQGKPSSVTQACAVFCKREPWKAMLRAGRNPAEALRRHYNTADLIWVVIVRNTRAPPEYEKAASGLLVSLREISGK